MRLCTIGALTLGAGATGELKLLPEIPMRPCRIKIYDDTKVYIVDVKFNDESILDASAGGNVLASLLNNNPDAEGWDLTLDFGEDRFPDVVPLCKVDSGVKIRLTDQTGGGTTAQVAVWWTL